MKKPLLIFTLLFSVIFSTTSFAEWTFITSSKGIDLYLDTERIKHKNGYIYYWDLYDYKKPRKGVQSSAAYNQLDCDLKRSKYLKDIYYAGPMQTGKIIGSSNEPDNNWDYPTPGSVNDIAISFICSLPN